MRTHKKDDAGDQTKLKINYRRHESLIKTPAPHPFSYGMISEQATPDISAENIHQEMDNTSEFEEICVLATPVSQTINSLNSSWFPFISSDTNKATSLFSDAWLSPPHSPLLKYQNPIESTSNHQTPSSLPEVSSLASSHTSKIDFWEQQYWPVYSTRPTNQSPNV
jgi:hypothetical protein